MPASGSVRRARDAAALLALEALESGASVPVVVLPLLAAAALPLPLSATCHPREKLLQLVYNAGFSAARSIEAASAEAGNLAGGPMDRSAPEPQDRALSGLSNDGPFRAFMALKLQAVEGAQVRGGHRRCLNPFGLPSCGL